MIWLEELEDGATSGRKEVTQLLIQKTDADRNRLTES